jgi:hypothetical protein
MSEIAIERAIFDAIASSDRLQRVIQGFAAACVLRPALAGEQARDLLSDIFYRHARACHATPEQASIWARVACERVNHHVAELTLRVSNQVGTA